VASAVLRDASGYGSKTAFENVLRYKQKHSNLGDETSFLTLTWQLSGVVCSFHSSDKEPHQHWSYSIIDRNDKSCGSNCCLAVVIEVRIRIHAIIHFLA